MTDIVRVNQHDVGRFITIDHLGDAGDIEGEDRDFGNWQEAKAYLNTHRFGVIVHPAMETESFVFMKNDGSLWFYECTVDDIEPVTAELEAQFADPEIWEQEYSQRGRNRQAWGYMQGREMALTSGGLDWFDEIRRSPEPTPMIGGPAI